MSIRVLCLNAACGKSFAVKDELAGKRIKCPGCQMPIEVTAVVPVVRVPPAAEATPESPSAAGGATALPPELTVSRLVIRQKGRSLSSDVSMFGYRISPATVTHTIEVPGSKEVVAIVRRASLSGFDWKRSLFGIETKPIRYDVRERENGPNLMSVSIYRPLNVQLNPLASDERFYEILDGTGAPLGRFRMKQKLFRADLDFRGPDDQVKTVVKWHTVPKSVLSSLVILAPNDVLVGRVLTEGMVKAEAKHAEGKTAWAMHTTGIFGNDGHVIDVAEKLVGKPAAHLMALGLGIIVEATGLGKLMTGAGP